MLGSQQFCVRWNSYQTNLQDVFPKLLNSEHFVDVTLACEAQMIKCHKVVLSACSTYFEQLLVQNPCQHPIIFMKDMKHWEVQALVDFMYKGEVNVTQEEISTLLKAAEALQIRGLCGADRQQDSNAVSLPPETTVSDSGGRETPPPKRRKFPEQQSERTERREKQQPGAPSSKQSNANPGPSVSSTPTSSSNDLSSVLGGSGSVTASVTSTPFRDLERNNSAKDSHPEEASDRSNIKREHVDQDDSYVENDEDYNSFDFQDDSNSMNPDISMPTSPLDQAGPSGMPSMQESKPTAGVVQRVGLGRSPARPSWLPPRAAAIDQLSIVPDAHKMMAPMSFQGNSQFDGGFSSLIQDSTCAIDMSDLKFPYCVEDNNVLEIPGGPVDLVDCRRSRISKSHSEEEKRERKLVLARLRQRRFREKMKRLHHVHHQ